MRRIVFFETEQGLSPIEYFLDGLPSKKAQKVIWVMKLVEDLTTVPAQYFKKLVSTADIWEIRVQVGSDIFRVLGFFAGDSIFVATNGFQKKTMGIPRSEKAIAEKRKAEYFARNRRKYT